MLCQLRRDAFRVVLGAAALAISGAGLCPIPARAADDWASVEAQAKKEGTLALSMIGSPDTDTFVGKIREKFPWLEVKFSGLVPSKFNPQVLAEQKNGVFNWDLYIGPTGGVNSTLAPANGVQDMEPWLDALPKTSVEPDKWAGGFREFTDPKRHYALLVYYRSGGGVFVNRGLASSKEVANLDDILKPEFRGKIATYDPSRVNGASMTIAVLYKNMGEAFVRKLLLDQRPIFASNPRNVADWLSEGRYPIGIYMLESDIAHLKAQGLFDKIEVLPRSRYVLAFGTTIYRNAPHPNVVKVVLNWFLSREGQQTYADVAPIGGSRRTDVTGQSPDVVAPSDVTDVGYIAGVTKNQEPLRAVIKIAKSR